MKLATEKKTMSVHNFAYGVRSDADATPAPENNSEFPTFAFDTGWYVLGKRSFNPIIQRVLDAFGRLPTGSWVIEPGNGDHRLWRLRIAREGGSAGHEIKQKGGAPAKA